MCSLSFNVQKESQPKLNSPTDLGEAEFDCKYPKLMYLFNLALFILKQKNFRDGFPLCLLCMCMIPNNKPWHLKSFVIFLIFFQCDLLYSYNF
jgi:hypothetical protein